MSRYWLSWWESAEDYRPLTYPPNDSILGWWCSGERDDANSLCALVEAKDEASAWKAIDKDWPGKREVRFINLTGSEFALSDRFPLSDWMEKRIRGKS